VAQALPDAIDNSYGDAERIASIASSMTAEDTQLYYQVAINGKRDMAYAADPRGGFEMVLLRMIAFRPVAVLDDSLTPEDVQAANNSATNTVAVEVGPAVKKPPESPRAAGTTAAVNQPMGAPAPPVAVAPRAATPEITAPKLTTASVAPAELPESAGVLTEPVDPIRALESEVTPGVPGQSSGQEGQSKTQLHELSPRCWPRVLQQLGLHGIVYNIASHCELRRCVDSNLEFILDESHSSLFNDKHRARITTVLEAYFGSSLSVSVEKGKVHTETPAMEQARITQERHHDAVISIESDPVLQQLIERFDGELLRSSIAPVEP